VTLAVDPPSSGGSKSTHLDTEQKTLRIAVTELLEQTTRSLAGLGRRGHMQRLWEGQALHAQVQAASAAGDFSYRSEVPLRARLDHAGWQISLHGRADGIREDAQRGLVVEEIKSVRRCAATDPRRAAIYRLQAALYGWMLHRESGLPVSAELLWVEIGSAHVTRESILLDDAALERELRERLRVCLERFEKESRAREARRSAAGRMSFPHASMRGGQERVIQAVESALEQREHLLLQASTGIGKTVATLFPALRFALAHDKQVYFLTPKNLQQETAMAALASLDPGQISLGVRLRAKAAMCASRAMTCHDDDCDFARDFAHKIQEGEVVERLLRHRPVVDPETLFEIAVEAEVCPFELSLAAAREAVVTVCDYNYAFDPVVSLREFSPDADLSDAILVVDEVHNLVDRARQIWSPVLEGEAIRRAEQAASLGGAPVHREVEALCGELGRIVSEALAEAAPGETPESWSLEHALPAEPLLAIRPRLDAAFVDYLEYRIETRSLSRDDPFLALYFALLRFVTVLSDGADQHAELVGRVDGIGRLRLLCRDPGPRLGAILNRCHSVIGLSATLTGPEFHRDLLGLDAERTTAVTVPSPFPPERQCVVIDSSVSTRWRDRARHSPRIARRIAAFAEQVPGHCLVLFSSYDFLGDVARRIPATGKTLLLQGRGTDERGREDILRRLRDPHTPPVLLLAVAGGVFAEGIDCPGESLRGVAVVGPCLPAPDLERQLLEGEYQERFDRGFDYAYAIPGMTRVIQGAGRLIRSERDTGVIALLGRRFLREPYRSLLPEQWLRGRPPEELAGNPAAAAKRFFGCPSWS
jgi:DNA excision repair protein ERCC-2